MSRTVGIFIQFSGFTFSTVNSTSLSLCIKKNIYILSQMSIFLYKGDFQIEIKTMFGSNISM